MSVEVVKASGDVEPFSREKVVASLVRSGVSRDRAEVIVDELVGVLPSRVSTREIYLWLRRVLRERFPRECMLYSLKEAIMLLGPEGYPFERFFAKLLGGIGYEVRVDVLLRGRCVKHEVDIVAIGGGRRYLVECKYHNSPGIKTDVKVALYVYSRFLDLKDYFDGAWIATNTKLTGDAIRYSRCVGMRVTAWRYPRDDGLESLIARTGLYPISVLLSLSPSYRRRLLRRGIVTVEDLKKLDTGELSVILGVSEDEAEVILGEARLL